MENHIKMQVTVHGEGTPILLVPGGLTGWKSWEPFIETFAGMHKKVILVQLLNVEYGMKGRPLPDDYSVKTESRALKAALDSLDLLGPLDIVAWSFGALITLDLVLDFPQLVNTLTLIEPPALWILKAMGEVDEETRHTVDFFRTLHSEITDEMLASFLQEVGFVKAGQSPRELPQWEQWMPYKQSLRNSPAIITQTDDLKRLREFKHPVLLVKGTGSATFLHRIIDGLRDNLPDARVIEQPGGHAPHIVSREKFLSELDKFQSVAVK